MPKLKRLIMRQTRINNLDLSNCVDLETVEADDSELTAFKAQNCKLLREVFLNNSKVSALELHPAADSKVEIVYIDGTKLTYSDLSLYENL